MNFNRLCSQKQFHIDPACIREVQEISLSSQFQHKHIVQYYGTFKGYLVDVNGTVKLVDFGLAKFCKLNDIKSFKGTAFRMAPEVINEDKQENDGYGFAADIWSLGCTVLEMLTRQHPYPKLEPVCISFNGNK
ncbi:mitogen-activated protein kinase kinase kinase 1 isoform X1 [Vitis vinifera]|uniref:mitogen-activated protein kinase kinase kinase 1 isoform X1 n=1 Tax=Vitis vinifera TaxID=29760 RepID=UPI0008FEB361|nr:mitogen-activated protein kinase kinase kinase 1 isoform X1 [Vitis vinifera]|eukprot:XP_019079295.1 PREDICTED: mitogen-activated protein kinase kinase kinase 1 [Vitis vinifera]